MLRMCPCAARMHPCAQPRLVPEGRYATILRRFYRFPSFASPARVNSLPGVSACIFGRSKSFGFFSAACRVYEGAFTNP